MTETSVRLFCLPYAGASASIYLPWSRHLGRSVIVTPVELPGRGSRIREKPHSRLEPLLHDLVPAVARMCDRPFAIFGHSLGALLAFEIAARLEWDHDLVAERLYVSGHGAPHHPRREAPVSHLPDDEFLARIREHYNTPEEAFADPRLTKMLLPMMRADFTLAESYEQGLDNVLHCPITAMGGLNDPGVKGPELAGWREYTRRFFKVRTFPGDHFFLRTAQKQLLDAFTEDLTRQYASHRRFHPISERTF
ncbi:MULTISPECIES: thioesterase II family protein [Streptomyces]|uniref:Thioesterase n=2 Tax=Streptomyces TaxID=1883 RepID=A0A4Q9HIY4_STRKA|nr:alpha/beta fold hydrolase [Streptomyces kasugaensis]TBO54568.1 thioesterase [Streptomyces kasugaensis]WSK10447.1 alpha/beta fold hydrolase [Streptomyces celluloflavus]WSK17118.1 alpha/beta fold hydrolase [Streptomyces celluloflavus]